MIKKEADLMETEINKIKEENWEQLYLIIKYSFDAILNYCIYSKTTMDVPSNALNVVGTFLKTFKEERKILKHIMNHISYIDREKLEQFLEELEKLNEQTINYLYKRLDNIEDAIELNDQNRMTTRKNFDLLPDNKNIKQEACNLVLSKEFIKSYLGYEESFWKFIDARTIFTDEVKSSKMDWEYNLGDQIKLILYLPPITDLDTALIAMKGYNKAHIIYLSNYKTSMENAEENVKKYYLDLQKHFNLE